jgi:adenylate cyclase class 2
MPLEIEAKLKVDSHDSLRTRLKELGALRLGYVLEANHIFDNAQRTLLAGGQGLRVRSCRSLEDPSTKASLTFKGPRLESDLKVREEINIHIDDAPAACQFLEALGYIEFLYFEKRRETWHLGECHIELDQLPHLGKYVEIEGPNQEQVRQTKELLELHNLPTINKSYIALLVTYCQQQSIPPTRITFEKV